MTAGSEITRGSLAFTLRRRVSVGGRLIDPGRRLGPHGRLELMSTQDAQGRPPQTLRTWHAEVRTDGRYYFIDVPDGTYRLAACTRDGESLASVVVPLGPSLRDPAAAYAMQVAFDLQIPLAEADPTPSAPASPPINVLS